MKLYLACAFGPVSDKDTQWRRLVRAVAWLAEQGHSAVCPVIHWWPVRLQTQSAEGKWESWEEDLIRSADALCIVLDLPAVLLSDGVRREVAMATRLGKPIFYLVEESHGQFTWLGRAPSSPELRSSQPTKETEGGSHDLE